MAKSTASTEAAETIGVLMFENVVDGGTAKYEQYSVYGHPAQFIKIADAATATSFHYPYDGDGLLDGVTSTSIIQIDKVTAGIPANCEGLLFQAVSGTTANRGATRRIVNHGGDRWMTLNAALPATPAIGDGYVLLVETFNLSGLVLKSEFSASGAQVADVIAFFYDYPKTLNATTAPRKSIVFAERRRTLDSLDIQNSGTETNGYYHGAGQQIDVRGGLGAKVRLVSVSSGNVSLWACGI